MATARKKPKVAKETRAVGAPLKITDQEIQDILVQYRDEILSPNGRCIIFNKIGNPVSNGQLPTLECAALRCGMGRQHLHRRCCQKTEEGDPTNPELCDTYETLKTAISMVWLNAGLSKAVDARSMMFALQGNRMYSLDEMAPQTQVNVIQQNIHITQQAELDKAYEAVKVRLRQQKEAMRQRFLSMQNDSDVLDG
jgi:hypothetical protein